MNKETYLKEYPKYTVDRLDYTEELRGKMKRQPFYVDFPTYEDELLILSFVNTTLSGNIINPLLSAS